MTDLNNNVTVLNSTFNITCGAQANPLAKYRFYREQESLFVSSAGRNAYVLPTSVGEGINQVNYRCTPFNGYGYGPTRTVTVTVNSKYALNNNNINKSCMCLPYSLITIISYMYSSATV